MESKHYFALKPNGTENVLHRDVSFLADREKAFLATVA